MGVQNPIEALWIGAAACVGFADLCLALFMLEWLAMEAMRAKPQATASK